MLALIRIGQVTRADDKLGKLFLSLPQRRLAAPADNDLVVVLDELTGELETNPGAATDY